MKRTAAVLGIALALACFGASTANAATPIRPENRPTGLPGQTNGVVSRSSLINVVPNCIAARSAAPSLSRLFTLARMSKVGLGAEECYRSLADQVKYANIANQPGNNPACVASVSRAPNGAPIGNSYHGWGKAVDLTDGRNSLTFASPGYAFMKKWAGSVGWNHPAFAEPGGSTCPEPWHWEWVGDGGNLHLSSVRGDVVGLLPSADDHGFGIVSGLGALEPHGNFVNRGDASRIGLQWVMIGAASKPSTATVTGWSVPTAACSRSVTLASTDRPAASGCRNRSTVWLRPRAARGTGSSRGTAASSASAMHASSARRARCA